MHHPLLGELALNKGRPESARGTVQYGGCEVSLGIEPGDRTLEEAISLAARIVASLSAFDAGARALLVKELLETYNSGWNEYNEVQEDGTLKVVCNPQLTAEEFQSKLTLDKVNVCGDGGVDFWYEDGGLFWGHGVYVSWSGGADFADAGAGLFG